MRSLKCVFSICAQNMRKWQTDYRVWCIALLVIVMTGIYVDDMHRISDVLGIKIPIWIFPFLYSQFHTKLIFTLPVVLLFCNAPFTDRNQTYIFMRSGRMKWLCGQILYIITASAAYYLFLLVISLLFTVFSGELSLDWGRMLNTLAISTGAAQSANAPYIEIPYVIIRFFNPLQAVWFTFLMSWLGGIFLGLLIFFCNLVSSTRTVGVLIASALVIVCSAVKNEGLRDLMPFSPISWTTLDSIDVGGYTTNPSFSYCLSVYAGLLVILTALIFIFGRKKSLDVKGN